METVLFLTLVTAGVWFFGGRRYFQINRAASVLAQIPGCSPMFSVIGTDGSGVAMDTATKKLAFVDRRGASSIYHFKDIVALEVCKNGVAFTKTNRGSQFVGAMIGKALFGPLGFEVGGRTGSSTTSERVTALSLKIYVSDIASPVREIGFYRGTGIEMNSRQFRKRAAALNEWYARLHLAMANP